jgi:hypothetical protein
MKIAWGGILLLTACPLGPAFGGTQDPEFNVNTRYTVETVLVRGDGWSENLASDTGEERISLGLRKQIAALIGDKLNPALLDELAGKLRREFQARTVIHRLIRGTTPEYVEVLFEIELRPTRFDVSVPKFAYTSAEGFSGALEATATLAQHHAFTFGLVSDGDDLVERYSGVVARYEDTSLDGGRVRAGFLFASYREEWNGATAEALSSSPVASQETSGLYRSRVDVAPEVTFVLARPLTLTVGADFEHFQDLDSEQTEEANALTSTLAWRSQVEDADSEQDVNADYSLRAASRLMASDYAYLRHHWSFRYALRHGKHLLSDRLIAGMLVGRAPLFERFVLGNSTMLRGWNKYDIDPVGGNRLIYNSVEYRYGWFQAFYDSGAVWNAGQSVTLRHSLGMGVHEGPVFLAVAIPARSGRVDPVFMVSMNY